MRETLDSEIPKRSAIVKSVAPVLSELSDLRNTAVRERILPSSRNWRIVNRRVFVKKLFQGLRSKPTRGTVVFN